MPGKLLITTAAEGLQPLGTPAQRSWELLSTTLNTRLGPEFGAMLAEPVATPAGDRIDWYTPDGAQTAALTGLSEDEVNGVEAAFAERCGAVLALAEQIEQTGLADDLRLGEALRNAMELPDGGMLYARRDDSGSWQPLMVHWAWSRGIQQSVQGGLSANRPKRTPVAAPQSPGTERHGAWQWLLLLGWLLLAIMIAAILWLTFAPCALNPFRPGFCPPEDAEIAAVLAERAVIEDELARLERELALANRTCQPNFAVTPAPAPAPPPPEPEPEPWSEPTPVLPDDPDPNASDQDQSNAGPDAAEDRVVERGGARGDLNFILEWASIDDVDLMVTCPAGEELSFLNRNGCGGTYDVDANVVLANAVEDPVENVVFGSAQPGLYKVRVHLRAARSGKEVPVRLHVLRRDGPPLLYAGKVSTDEATWTLNINISK